MGRSGIIGRLEAAIEKARARQLVVRAIYLTGEDRLALSWALRVRRKPPTPIAEWRGHEIRDGRQSRIYSTHGVSVAVPARLSPRVGA